MARTKTTPRKIRSNINKMKLKCHLCGKAYSCLRSIKRHLSVQHQKTMTGYECPICDTISTRRDNYVRHMRTKHQYLPTEDVPDPKLSIYNPVCEAKKPEITRPWEATPKMGINTDYSHVKFRIVAGASKMHLSTKNKETFVPQAPSLIPPCYEYITYYKLYQGSVIGL